MKPKMKLLDLFSGIGGFALGLRPVMKTIGYCEIDKECRQVLQHQMAAGRIDKAPIWSDVRTLPIAEIGILKPDVITAGFPCQDVSVANTSNPLGVHGPRTGLFREAIRLAQQISSVTCIFLENSPLIKSRGMPELMEFLIQAGFRNIQWCVFACSDLGGPHQRKRWYCLASKSQPKPPRNLNIVMPYVSHQIDSWKREIVRRIVPKESKYAKFLTRRLQMLGNSVVPAVVLFVYYSLRDMKTSGEIKLDIVKDVRRPVHKLTSGKEFILWATPVATWIRRCKFSGPRSERLLANQILYEKQTVRQLKHGNTLHDVHINPEFIEWMMGYPLGWTQTT